MQIKKHIPNLITMLNLFCGCIAIVFVAQLKFELAFYFVCLGIFLDFFDGFFARLFKVSSPLGLQLDSLADMVTSGLVPGFTMFWLIRVSASSNVYLPYLGFVIALASCYRLAKFNIDSRQTDSFIGLPTPANALLIMSLPLIVKYSDSFVILEILTDPYILLAITLLSAVLMNIEIHLFSLKVHEFSLQHNKLQIGFLILSAILLLLLQYLAIPLIILSYVILSYVNNQIEKK